MRQSAGPTASELERFRDQGFLLVEGLLDPVADLDPILAENEGVLDRLAAELRADLTGVPPYPRRSMPSSPASSEPPHRTFSLLLAPRGLFRRSSTPLIRSLAFSPIMIAAALVLELIKLGMIEESQTRRPSTLPTRRHGSTTAILSMPIRQVPTGW